MPRCPWFALILLLGAGCAPESNPLDDADGDGVSDALDCEDAHDGIFPGAEDVYGDFVDTDCDGADGVDADGDGYPAPGPGVPADQEDCDDEDPTVNPGAFEVSFDEVDSDCDGDPDNQGWCVEEDEDAPDAGNTDFDVPDPPLADYQDLGPLTGSAHKVTGVISDVVENTWDGDSDVFQFSVPDGGHIELILEFDAAADLDLLSPCYHYDQVNPPNWYQGLFVGDDGLGLATTQNPEQGVTALPLPAGAVCQPIVFGYGGPGPVPYTLQILVVPPPVY